MLTLPEFMSLKQGENVSYCGKRFIVNGRTDTDEPQLVSTLKGETLSGAIYGCHLMTVIPPEQLKVIEEKEAKLLLIAEKKKTTETAFKELGDVSPDSLNSPAVASENKEVIEFEVPAKKKRGRPRKNP